MNVRPHININGVSSLEVTGLLITDLGAITKPLVRTLVDVVDGRDGDIVTKLGFSAYDRVIKVGLTANYDIDSVIKFFNSEGSIIFSNEPDKIYKFAIYEPIDFERLLRFKTAEITLHIQPFKFSVKEQELEFLLSGSPNSIEIYNAGNYYATPVITLVGTGDVSLALNGSELLVIAFGETSQTIIIDAEELNAYAPAGTLLNRLVTGNYDNIKFGLGNNTITLTGNVTTAKIKNYSRYI
jgi:phage-related protein